MKILIYFFSCLLLSLPHLANAQIFGKSPEEKCVDAQMKVWDAAAIEKDHEGDRYKHITGYRGNLHKKGMYFFEIGPKILNAKNKFEADAWVKCMKK